MRSIVTGIAATMLVFVIYMILFTSQMHSNRQAVLDNAVTFAMQKALEVASQPGDCPVTNDAEFAQLFETLLRVQRGENVPLSVEYLANDFECGLLDVIVRERYTQLDRSTAEVSVHRTILRECYETDTARRCELVYLLEDTKETDVCYAKYYGWENRTFLVTPPNPVVDGRTFRGWRQRNADGSLEPVQSEQEIRLHVMEDDCVYIACFENE